jgi:hypothetical protein
MIFVHPTPFIKVQAEPFVGYFMTVVKPHLGAIILQLLFCQVGM